MPKRRQSKPGEFLLNYKTPTRRFVESIGKLLVLLIFVALVLIGIFSVMAYTVALQTHDIGVRLALGAQQGNVLKMVLWNGLRLISAGMIIGVLASLGLAHRVGAVETPGFAAASRASRTSATIRFASRSFAISAALLS